MKCYSAILEGNPVYATIWKNLEDTAKRNAPVTRQTPHDPDYVRRLKQ